jgi:hypothetical protein
MEVIMLESTKGSPNGIEIIELIKDQDYDLPEGLAKNLIAGGLAKRALRRTTPAEPLSAPQKQVVEKAPETKDTKDYAMFEDLAALDRKRLIEVIKHRKLKVKEKDYDDENLVLAVAEALGIEVPEENNEDNGDGDND